MEISASRSDLGEVDIVRLARRVAETEVAELNPGASTRPKVSIQCDIYECIGDQVPKEIYVMVRMKMVDQVFPVLTDELFGTDGIWLYAEVRVPYVGD